MSDYQVRIRYAGSVLVEVQADSEAQAREKGERMVQQMDSDAFLSALEPQHLGTEVTRLYPGCRYELQGPERCLCSEGDDK